ncbi:MAG: radical SAM protein [Candidatus Eiseniibacteriota bacterium]|jgi:hypothetical protein
MALSGVHILLTYACTYECDHCFLYCSPRSEGTFTIAEIERVLEQAREVGTVTSIYLEGGEPFLFYPVMVEGLRLARRMGFRTGVVTNCYWASSDADARLWLGPIVDTGIDDLSVSDDAFHHGEGGGESPGARAARVARELGLPAASICIEQPAVEAPRGERGQPVVGGGVLFKGRAAETLTGDLPTRPRDTFTCCPHEELVAPERVHVDAFGTVQVCQGVSIGNLWRTPLAQLMARYEAARHAVCGPLVRGGPRALADEHGVALDGDFVDECHYCFSVRRALLERLPEALGPRQVYGL